MNEVFESGKAVLEQWSVFAGALVVFLYSVEKALELFSTLTPWKWDDNAGVILGKLIQKLPFVPKPK